MKPFGKNIDDLFFLVNCAKFEPDRGKFIINIKFVQSSSNFAQFTNIKKQVHYYPSLSQNSGFESYELSIFIEKKPVLTDHWKVNENSNNWIVVNAALAMGAYPNIARFDSEARQLRTM